MKKIILLLLSITAFVSSKAQELVPKDYKFETKEDFQQYEPNVKACIHWLQITPRSEEKEKRTATEEFLVKWIKESPYVTVIIEPYIMKLLQKNPDLLLTFMFGYTQYQLDNPEIKTLLNANVAGLENIIRDYTLNSELLKKDAKLEEVIKLQKEGRLNSWIEPQLTQPKLN
jgi:ABC-type Fe3+-hydroxamate transport system substrate-binding protein